MGREEDGERERERWGGKRIKRGRERGVGREEGEERERG